MNSNAFCPACGSELTGHVSLCPFCGFNEINRIFLNAEDREIWQRKVLLPFIDSIIPEIHVNMETAIFLTVTGDLYGIGQNDKHQISDDDTFLIKEPVLIARNVKSADISKDYVIYADRSGDVHLVGSGVYADKFSGFHGAEEVQADKHENIFWIIDRVGKVFAFGDNNFYSWNYNYNTCIITSSKAEEEVNLKNLKGIFPHTERRIRINGNFYYEFGEHSGYLAGYAGEHTCVYEYTDYDDKKKSQLLSQQASETQAYATLLKEYSEQNIALEFIKIPEQVETWTTSEQNPSEHGNVSGEAHHFHNWTRNFYEAWAVVRNTKIYVPHEMPFSADEIPNPAFTYAMPAMSVSSLNESNSRKINDYRKRTEKSLNCRTTRFYMMPEGVIVIAIMTGNRVHVIYRGRQPGFLAYSIRNCVLYLESN